MGKVIDVIGIGADGPASLRPELRERIAAADFLAGGERQLSFFPEVRGQRFVIKDNLADLREELGKRFPEQNCVILASGDPLFYGIGTYLAGICGSQNVRIEPALSSMQLAFARAGISWQDASLASIHGRDPRPVLLPLLGQPLIGLFTQDGDSPAQAARFFLRYGLNDYEAIVGENLGAPGERVSRWPDLKQLAEQRFAPLNYLILQRTRYPQNAFETQRHRALVPGTPDEVFARPLGRPEMMTHQEVRSVVLGKLVGATEPGDILWDIGAGLGTVAVEMAVLRPHLEVVAVERDPERAAYLRQNQERFGAYNIRVLEGQALEVLTQENERPRLVFLGGSGDQLGGILDLTKQRLRPGGRLLANFVTLEHLGLMLQRLRDWGWAAEITEVQVARGDSLAGLTGLKPQRGVFLVGTTKPEAGHG